MVPSGGYVPPAGIGVALSWRRVRFTLVASAFLGLLLSILSTSPTSVVVGRALLVGFVALLAFGLLEQWPKRLPAWLARWVLQLVGVVVAVPLAALVAYWATTGGDPRLSQDRMRFVGYVMLTSTGVIFGLWIAFGALLRQREALTRSQALSFDLERSQAERSALDARLRLLQTQVEPHFLFNTLANVQALVDSGSPQASQVLRSLIAYLRAAVPGLHDPATTLGQEVRLARAYLEVMQMRMPDRLDFAVRVDEDATGVRCPSMALMTLVENAIRHGIDPSEEGGSIEIDVKTGEGRAWVRVTDTGVGFQASGESGGTGLSTLRERLRLAFGEGARLRVTPAQPRGVCAELELPTAREFR